MCRDSEYPYERFLHPDDRSSFRNHYISSIIPNWTMGALRLNDFPQEILDQILDNTLPLEEYDISSLLALKVQSIGEEDRDSALDGNAPPAVDDAMEVDEGGGPAKPPPTGLRAGVRYHPDSNILCASRPLHNAYQKRAKSLQTLVLTDSEAYNFQRIVLPLQITGVLWLELYLILFCHSCPFHDCEGHCRAAAEITRHKEWVEDVLMQLPYLRGVRIFVHLANSDFIPGQKNKLPCESLVEGKLLQLKDLSKVDELIFYRLKFEEERVFYGPKDLVCHWKPESVE